MPCMPFSPILVGFQPEDDVDTLFRRLPQIEPSDELIARILTQVQRLPGPLRQQSPLEVPEDEEVDALVVRNEMRDPS
jgi:hypothetical protein